MRVAFQGEPGAYSEQAVLDHFGAVEPVPCPSFDAVFAAVAEGDCPAALVPIENSLAGSIHQNYDLLVQHDLHITGEHLLRVHHCLIALPGVEKADLRRALSHPQALGQCARYLKAAGLRPEPAYDTAGSVKLVRDADARDAAAIASRRAADLNGMAVLEEGIEDDPSNTTRFLEIRPRPGDPGGDAKTSIVLALKNVPGALFKAMSVFALRDIDLCKIESRPLPGRAWEYLFYIDFIGAAGREPARRALDHLGEYATMLRVLGSYPRFRERPEG